LLQGRFVVVVERPLAANHFVKDAAEGPDVGLLVVGLALKHLRAAVGQRAGEVVRKVVALTQLLAYLCDEETETGEDGGRKSRLSLTPKSVSLRM